MSLDRQDGAVDEPNGTVTPSTASRVKPVPVENAFPTPPRRETCRTSDTHQSGRLSPAHSKMFAIGKASPGPKEHKSIEALRATISRRDYRSGRSSATDVDNPTRKEISQKKSQLFDQAFAVRDSYYSARERITRDSLIVVELRLNCVLEQENSFLNDFQLLLSETYYKPCHNIMISVNMEHRIMMGTSQDPAYLMHVTALPAEIAPLKNLRAMKMVQEFLSENLHISSNRGVIMFNSVREEDYGTNGSTIEDEITRLEADDKREMSLRSRQSTRNKRGSTLTGTSEALHLDNTKPEAALPYPSEEFGEGEEHALEKSTRSTSNAGKKLAGKKSFIMSLWKKH